MAQPAPDAEGAAAAPLGLPTRHSMAALRARLAVVEARRARLFAQGDRLVQGFAASYPEAPARLVRYADRTLNDYRWRLSGHAQWRHLGLPTNKAAVELTGATGRRLLAALPAPARADWLRWEAQRQALNHASALAKYEVLRLHQLIERQEALRQLLRQGEAAP